MSYTKHLLILLVVTMIGAWALGGTGDEPEIGTEVLQANLAGSSEYIDSAVDYKAVEKQLAEIRREQFQPNILKDDIVRGWYIAGEDEKKYGTPDSWVFFEDGEDSRWISPNALEEIRLVNNKALCVATGGIFVYSCLDSTDTDCEYTAESYCRCMESSKWKEDQGCILMTIRKSYVAINSEELEQGWYKGQLTEKKLNTPSDWVWEDRGPQSVWQRLN